MTKLDRTIDVRVWELIKKSDKITLSTHIKPDGDGVSACAAFDIILTAMGKTVETVYPTSPEFEFKRQPRNVLVDRHTQQPDLLIAFDTANYERLYYPSEFKEIPLINIDHHVSNSIDGTYNIIDPNAASTCEVLYKCLCEWDKSVITKQVAEALLFGILYDSRVFHTQATTPETLRISADLMEYGVDLFKLKVELLANKSPKVLKLWELVLNRITVSKSGQAVWSYISQEDVKSFDLALSSLIGFNDFLSDVCGVDISLLFYETEEGKTKVSLRSKEFDVNKLASQFGGGGHKNAAGILSDKSIDVLMSEVTEGL